MDLCDGVGEGSRTRLLPYYVIVSSRINPVFSSETTPAEQTNEPSASNVPSGSIETIQSDHKTFGPSSPLTNPGDFDVKTVYDYSSGSLHLSQS